MSLKSTDIDVLAIWKRRIEMAQANAAGLSLEFHTSYQTLDKETQPYHDHSGQSVRIETLLIDPGVKFADDGFDEETLPYFVGRFGDGDRLVCGFEETFTHDVRLLELKSAVNAGFSISRRMGYGSPHHLAVEGTEAEKRVFVDEVQTLSFGNDQNFNTPPEYRLGE